MFSSIIKKKCRCGGKDGKGCNQWPSTGFSGYYFSHAPDEVKDAQGIRAKKSYQASLNRAKQGNLSRKVFRYGQTAETGENEPQNALRSQMLKEADKVFSLFIRKRDADKNGNIDCVCCGKIYNLEDKTENGDTVVQCLHFVQRGVYSLRYDPVNCHAGCGWCNKDMNDNPEGTAYHQFRDYLVDCIGEEEVAAMEVQKRSINKITHEYIRSIIKKYGS